MPVIKYKITSANVGNRYIYFLYTDEELLNSKEKVENLIRNLEASVRILEAQRSGGQFVNVASGVDMLAPEIQSIKDDIRRLEESLTGNKCDFTKIKSATDLPPEIRDINRKRVALIAMAHVYAISKKFNKNPNDIVDQLEILQDFEDLKDMNPEEDKVDNPIILDLSVPEEELETHLNIFLKDHICIRALETDKQLPSHRRLEELFTQSRAVVLGADASIVKLKDQSGQSPTLEIKFDNGIQFRVPVHTEEGNLTVSEVANNVNYALYILGQSDFKDICDLEIKSLTLLDEYAVNPHVSKYFNAALKQYSDDVRDKKFIPRKILKIDIDNKAGPNYRITDNFWPSMHSFCKYYGNKAYSAYNDLGAVAKYTSAIALSAAAFMLAPACLQYFEVGSHCSAYAGDGSNNIKLGAFYSKESLDPYGNIRAESYKSFLRCYSDFNKAECNLLDKVSEAQIAHYGALDDTCYIPDDIIIAKIAKDGQEILQTLNLATAENTKMIDAIAKVSTGWFTGMSAREKAYTILQMDKRILDLAVKEIVEEKGDALYTESKKFFDKHRSRNGR